MKTFSSYLTIRSLSDIYNLIYYKLYQNTRGWIKHEDEATKKKLHSFLCLLNDIYGISSIGTNFISEYLFYQFCYWVDKKTRYEMKLDWVIGKKAVERYQSASHENIYVCVERMDALGVSTLTIRDLLLREQSKKATIQNTNPAIEAAKERISPKARFAYCVIQGLNYSEYSKVCQSCISAKNCKELK